MNGLGPDQITQHRKVVVKKNSAHRKQERRKPTNEEVQAKTRKVAATIVANNHNRLAESYNTVVGLHETVLGQLEHVAGIASVVTNPEIKECFTPEIEKELAKSLKVVIDGVKYGRTELNLLTRELNELTPDSKNVPKGEAAADRNMTILTMGSRYGAIMDRHETVTMPAVATCIDLMNSVLPDEKRLNMNQFTVDLTQAHQTIDEEMQNVDPT